MLKLSMVDLQDVATIMVTSEEAEKYALKSGELLMTEGGDRDKLGRGTIWHGDILVAFTRIMFSLCR